MSSLPPQSVQGPEKPDLDRPEAIAQLVPTFYERVQRDDLLGPIFTEVAQVDWDEHLPKLTAFWCQMVLGIPGFRGSPAAKHVQTARKHPFTLEHFDRWITLFHDTIDRAWHGPKAEEIKNRSVMIARYQAQLVGAGDWSGPASYRGIRP